MTVPQRTEPRTPVTISVTTKTRLAVPTGDAIVILAAAASGVLAGYMVDSKLWIATALVVAILVAASSRAQSERDIGDSGAPPMRELPSDLRRVVSGAVASLGDCDAQRRLMAVVQPARSWFATRESTFGRQRDDEAGRHVSDLLTDSCSIALDLARLDEVTPGASADPALTARFQTAHALFVKRLDDAAAALSELYASGVERGTPASDRVAELASEIKDEASARSAAKADVDALLANSPLTPGS